MGKESPITQHFNMFFPVVHGPFSYAFTFVLNPQCLHRLHGLSCFSLLCDVFFSLPFTVVFHQVPHVPPPTFLTAGPMLCFWFGTLLGETEKWLSCQEVCVLRLNPAGFSILIWAFAPFANMIIHIRTLRRSICANPHGVPEGPDKYFILFEFSEATSLSFSEIVF